MNSPLPPPTDPDRNRAFNIVCNSCGQPIIIAGSIWSPDYVLRPIPSDMVVPSPNEADHRNCDHTGAQNIGQIIRDTVCLAVNEEGDRFIFEVTSPPGEGGVNPGSPMIWQGPNVSDAAPTGTTPNDYGDHAVRGISVEGRPYIAPHIASQSSNTSSVSGSNSRDTSRSPSSTTTSSASESSYPDSSDTSRVMARSGHRARSHRSDRDRRRRFGSRRLDEMADSIHRIRNLVRELEAQFDSQYREHSRLKDELRSSRG